MVTDRDSFALAPLTQLSLTQMAANALVDLIVDRRLKPGEALPSAGDLAALLGVSRPVVREATAELAGQGILRRHQGRESVVTMPGPEQLERLLRMRFAVSGVGLKDVHEIRMPLEAYGARLAAERVTSDGVRQLEEKLVALEGATEETELHDADAAFHRAIAVLAANDVILLLLDALSPLLRKLRTELWAGWLAGGQGLQENFQAHRSVFDAIAAGDADGASAAMQAHLCAASSGATSQ